MMKQLFRTLAISAVLLGSTLATAQEVNTLYFLENAPQRTMFNPALMPVSSGYIMFSPLGYTSLWAGNNSFTLSNLIYSKDGASVTPLNTGETGKFLNVLRKSTLVNFDMTTTILAFGARTKQEGFFHAGIFLRADGGVSLPKDLFSAFLNKEGLALDLTQPMSIKGLGASAEAYMEFMGGYTRALNDQWVLGGKLKFLIGLAHIAMDVNNVSIEPGEEGTAANIKLNGVLQASLPKAFDTKAILPAENEGFFENMDARWKNVTAPVQSALDNHQYGKLIAPAGYGAAIDFGFTYKPIKYVMISAAINDLGFIYWGNAVKGTIHADTPFDGIGKVMPHVKDGKIDSDDLQKQVSDHMQEYLNAIKANGTSGGYARMTRAHLNVAVDGLFWEDRVGVSLLSQTKLYNKHIYEELTLGAFFRPVHWFNLAASYSLLNGKGGNIGAALGFAPYDGVMMTLAMDYVPLYYADMSPLVKSSKPMYYMPYKTPGVNLALGFSIVWGTNKRRDADRDGVLDKLDMCPQTPRNVRVDALGCPVDTDGDGVPDYLDECMDTPQEAYGMVDPSGCMLDTDLDGVPDYLDLCPDTPEEARASVDENGCTRDTDHDGVPDYRDDCPSTLPEAAAFVDEHGCDKDSDGDGVPDYMDKCPDTPEEAFNYLDEHGCPLDLDEDGVPDYKDKCPRTVLAARAHVDTCGCDKDTDLDGVPDYMDECPLVPGVKENKGCPQVKRAVTTLLKKAMSGIEFETGKAVILKKSYSILDEIAKVFIENKDYIVEVQGHTDNVGNAEVNMYLSEKRAQAVREYLIKKGVDAKRLTANGYGSSQPIADNTTKAGRAKNRRVEFKITFEEIHFEVINDHNLEADSTAVAPEAEPVAE